MNHKVGMPICVIIIEQSSLDPEMNALALVTLNDELFGRFVRYLFGPKMYVH